MKRLLVLAGGLVATVAFALPAGAASPATNPIVNPGFETDCPPIGGEPAGWTVAATTGTGQWAKTNQFVQVEGNCAAIGCAAIGNGEDPGEWQYLTSTPFNLGSGQQLVGWTRFLDAESNAACGAGFCDEAEVRVLRVGPTFGTFTTLVFNSATSPPDSGWVKWSFKTPSPGAWVVQYRVRNIQDDVNASGLVADANGLGSVSISPKP